MGLRPAISQLGVGHPELRPDGVMRDLVYKQDRHAQLGKHRGAKVAQVDIARKLTEAIWHMLTNNESFSRVRAGHDQDRATA
jgi:hypothetical protein